MKQPCEKDCPYRTATCHTTCLKYKDYEQANAVRREAIKEKKATANMIRNHKKYMCEKARRRH